MAVADIPLTPTAAARAPAVAASRAPAALAPGIASVRVYFAVLSLVGVAAFLFGIENRFTADGLFRVPPSVDWIPPLSAPAWLDVFVIHQQDPVFTSCGGTESLGQFKMLYWWEWFRRASLLALAATAAIGFYGACLLPRFRFALPRLGALVLFVFAYWAVRILVDLALSHIDALARFNVGQYRHAVDVTFASAAAAAVLASAVTPPGPAARAVWQRIERHEWLWIAAILVDVWFGALFAARNAAPFWWTWPGYEGHLAPPVGQLLSYSPWWLNFTFNPYMIQLVHRGLSGLLLVVALWGFASALLRRARAGRPLVRAALLTAQMATGIATLLLAVPAPLSIVHQLGPIVLIAASLVPRLRSFSDTAARSASGLGSEEALATP
jgi:cytochrome c oxidase assembly protein subunit 15